MSEKDKGKSLKRLRSSRAAHKGVASRYIKESFELLDQPLENEDEKNQLLRIKQKIELKLEDILAKNAEIEQLVANSDLDDELKNVEANIVEVQDAIFDIDVHIKAYDDKMASRTFHHSPSAALVSSPLHMPSASAFQAPVTAHLKLPKLELPQFSGKYTEWTSFKDLFDAAVDSNMTLSDSQKLNYLKSSMKAESEPQKLISSLAITDDNYQVAKDLLCERYDNKRSIVRAHIQAICNYPALKSESAPQLRKLQSTMNEHILALESHGIEKKHDAYSVYIIAEKLDPDSRKEWEIQSTGTDLQKLPQLLQFIDSRARALEASPRPQQQTPQKPQVPNVRQQQAYHAQQRTPCPQCNDTDHRIFKCPKFIELNIADRASKAKTLRLCLNCLSSGHFSSDCPSKNTCRTCNKKHHSLLHKPQEASSLFGSVCTKSTGESVLSTVLIKAQDRYGNWVQLRALLDSGSNLNVMTSHAVHRLGLRRNPTSASFTGLARAPGPRPEGMVNVKLYCSYKEEQLEMSALILKTITGQVPRVQLSTAGLDCISDLKLADPDFMTPGPIDILIGTDLYDTIVLTNKLRLHPKLFARETLCGWIISGTMPAQSSSLPCASSAKNSRKMSSNSHLYSLHASSSCEYGTTQGSTSSDDLLKRFWEIEAIPSRPRFTPEEQACEEFFDKTTTRDADGRFCVQLPFKPDAAPLGDSFQQAKRRFLSLESRARHTPQWPAYQEFIKEFQDLDHLEKVPLDEIDLPSGDIFYMPHHFVLKDSSATTKLRVVFDASAKSTQGNSLNDCLMTGPTLQDDLPEVLLRFRFHLVALSADVEKMYRQVAMQPESRNFHRILWRTDPGKPIETWRMTRVTYGVRASAHLSVKSLRRTAELEPDSIAAPVILRDFIVDDLLTGAQSVDAAKTLQAELNRLLASSGMNLRKWSSNVPEGIQHLPMELQEKPQAYEIKDSEHQIMVLGVKWLPIPDHFTFTVEQSLELSSTTKRRMLSDTARLYDPMGWLAPIIISFKILIQRTWVVGVSWDENLPDDIFKDWLAARSDLPAVSQITIPRCVLPGVQINDGELHVFCDASEKACAAAVYLRIMSSKGFKVSLLAAKSKVAPVKKLTLPRLELCAAVLGSRLLDFVRSTLAKLHFKPQDVRGWTDSTVVLSWLSSYPSQWGCFVGNRVQAVQDLIPPANWAHVASSDNPADCASRGLKASDLVNFQLWWQGPQWLASEDSKWPPQPFIPTTTPVERSKRAPLAAHVSAQKPVIMFERFRNFRTLLRATAYVLRFIDYIKGSTLRKGAITQEEIVMTNKYLLQLHQAQHFASDLRQLDARAHKMQYSGRLLPLSPFIDKDDNLLKVGGRLAQGPQAEEQRYPVLVDGKTPFALLLIQQSHLDTLHGGPQATLYDLRQKYWITDGPRAIQRFTRACVTCRRFAKLAAPPQMADLPAERITPSRPFTNTGVDFAGPITKKSSLSKAQQKAYICFFICFATKAIHLELVTSLSTAACKAALKRFVARRGLPSTIFSDNGTNFVGARNELEALQNVLAQHGDDSLNVYATNRGIQWVTIPPRAPHFGGLWEAGVKSCKILLRKVVGMQILTFEELYTVLTQVEAALNSRPLTPMSQDPNDLNVLTPGHFLIGAPLTSLPDKSSTTASNSAPLQRWKLTQKIADDFWARWSKEYLANMQQRQKWKKETEPFKVDDLVLIREDRTPPLQWARGRITKVFTGDDGIARVAQVRTAKATYNRPIAKLIKLLPTSPQNDKSPSPELEDDRKSGDVMTST